MTEKEKSLLAGCIRGDKASWDAFVLQYSALVYHTIRKTFELHHAKLNDDVIEDLYQEFFVSILREDFKKLRQFKGDRGCTLASWLRLVAARRTIDFLRKQEAPAATVGDDVSTSEPDLENRIISEQGERDLCAALESLAARERLFIELHYRKGLSAEEVAAVLRISVGAVYTQKSRVVAKLRQILDKIASL
jgi:RNA polymerase sigma factor (sigma-70 family)